MNTVVQTSEFPFVRLLMVEDSDNDAQLIARALRRSGITVEYQRAEDATTLRQAIAQGPWDLVLSDHILPGFGSGEALEILRESGVEAPFLIVSGRIGEEAVAEVLRQGADEYVNKDHLETLLPAVLRSLHTTQIREEQRRAQTRLSEAEELFRLAFDNAPIGIALLSPDGRWLRVNRALLPIVGYSKEELLTKTFQDVTHPDDLETDLEYVRQMLAGEISSYSMEKRYIRADNTIVWIQLSVSLVRTADGMPQYFISQIQDIDQRKRADDKIRGLLEAAPDATVIINDRGQITLINAQTEKLFGYHRDELIGQPVEILVPTRLHGLHRRHRDGFLADPHVRAMGEGIELFACCKDGSEIPVEISLSPFAGEGGTLTSAAIRDVTERKLFEQKLRETNRQLEDANQAKDRFLASISHELRTPLNAILGFTGILLMGMPGPLNTEQTKQLETVQNSGKHLLSLINDLLDLAKIESGKYQPKLEEIKCRELMDEVALGLAPLAEAKGLALNVLSPGATVVNADRRALSQILINLTQNAIKFTEQGEIRIELSQHKDDDAVVVTRFSVRDTGRGIGADDQAKLFAAFEQISGPGTRPFEGTGLGLYISKTLANLMGADISFTSKAGVGSVFTLEMRELVIRKQS